MRRRSLLATLPVALSGCTAFDGAGSTATETDTSTERPPVSIDCEAAERPPATADDADAVEPRPYPDPPADGSVTDWAVEHERAYVTNRLLAEETLASVTAIGVEARTTEPRPDGMVVRFLYSYGYSTDEFVADSPAVTAAYYVDGRGALRATDAGGGFAADLDPAAEGTPVVCF
jgi:hypothetical protein